MIHPLQTESTLTDVKFNLDEELSDDHSSMSEDDVLGLVDE